MYSAAAGMAAQQQRLDALSNDLANVNTTGYKRVRVAFRDLLYTQTGAGAARGVSSGAGAAATEVGRGQAQGNLQTTGNQLDLALTGTGYLQVRDAQGRLALTRDGALHRQDDGRLMTSAGAWTGVRLPAGVDEKNLTIAPDGTVSTGGRRLGRLQLVTVRAPEQLQAVGDNLFRTNAASGAPRAAGAGLRVQQGTLEASNVQVADVMTDLADAQRAFQMASRALTTQDKLLEIANGVKR